MLHMHIAREKRRTVHLFLPYTYSQISASHILLNHKNHKANCENYEEPHRCPQKFTPSESFLLQKKNLIDDKEQPATSDTK